MIPEIKMNVTILSDDMIQCFFIKTEFFPPKIKQSQMPALSGSILYSVDIPNNTINEEKTHQPQRNECTYLSL